MSATMYKCACKLIKTNPIDTEKTQSSRKNPDESQMFEVAQGSSLQKVEAAPDGSVPWTASAFPCIVISIQHLILFILFDFFSFNFVRKIVGNCEEPW